MLQPCLLACKPSLAFASCSCLLSLDLDASFPPPCALRWPVLNSSSSSARLEPGAHHVEAAAGAEAGAGRASPFSPHARTHARTQVPLSTSSLPPSSSAPSSLPPPREVLCPLTPTGTMTRAPRRCSPTPAVSALLLLSLLLLCAHPHHGHSRPLPHAPLRTLLQHATSSSSSERSQGHPPQLPPPPPAEQESVDFTPCGGWEASPASPAHGAANCPPPGPQRRSPDEDPIFGSAKRLVPTGPDRLHN